MYKKWTVNDIQEEIKRIAFRLSYPCDIKIEISNRATKRLGAFFYKKNNNKIEPIKFVFAAILIDGAYPEKIVKEVIIHEYLHYYCDTKSNISNGHNSFFKEMCVRCGINPKATIKCDVSNKSVSRKNTIIYKIHCSSCGSLVCIHKRKDAAERKIKNYISKCCNSKLKMAKF